MKQLNPNVEMVTDVDAMSAVDNYCLTLTDKETLHNIGEQL
ncbi:hypothetical protein RWV98_18765 [Agathobaculum sp. NTUH-O15-33]|nr:hypothetical protein [Agathobaculum sp. NTUH-O15-33]WNX84592.1 hypothetical protein RWV98_18765 [Agathobaculum sp. NTUH-O15-33]